MEQKFYLLSTIIETQDEVSNGHALYVRLEDALKAMSQEVSECQDNFRISSGSTILELPRYKEWRTEDGYGYTVAIEEIIPI